MLKSLPSGCTTWRKMEYASGIISWKPISFRMCWMVFCYVRQCYTRFILYVAWYTTHIFGRCYHYRDTTWKSKYLTALVSLIEISFKKPQYFTRKVYSIFWSRPFPSIDKFNLLNHSKSENWWFRWRSDFVAVIKL